MLGHPKRLGRSAGTGTKSLLICRSSLQELPQITQFAKDPFERWFVDGVCWHILFLLRRANQFANGTNFRHYFLVGWSLAVSLTLSFTLPLTVYRVSNNSRHPRRTEPATQRSR